MDLTSVSSLQIKEANAELTKAIILAIVLNMELSVAQAKDQFSRCLSRAQAGETVTIRKHGKPVAQITGIPDKPKNRLQFDSAPGSVRVLCDLTEPAIPEEDWECLR